MKLFFRNLIFFLAIITATVIPYFFFQDPQVGILSTKTKELLASKIYINSFYIHVILGGIALGLGWIGFVDKIRAKFLGFHRIAGRIYVFCFLITAITSVLVSYNSYGGLVSQVGFMSVGIIAIFTTLMGFSAILKKEIKQHQAWMRYSYACCLASVMLRIWSPGLSLFISNDILVYQIVAWLSWVPNLLYVKFVLNK